MTPLPLTFEPQPDEAWRSYLYRVAKSYRCTTDALGDHLGLKPTGRWPADHGITLDPALTEHVATQLGLTPAQITAMHPARWDGHALQISAITKQAPHAWPIVPISWTYLRQPRTCDECIAQYGYQRLTWHLPWATHCPEHSALLSAPHELDGASDGKRRTSTMLKLLTETTGSFAGEEAPAPTVLRAWLECAILTAATERPDWRTPPTAQTASRWLGYAEPIAMATTTHQAEKLLKPIIENPQVRAGRYAQASLYSPPMRNLIDSVHARWSRALPPEPKPRATSASQMRAAMYSLLP